MKHARFLILGAGPTGLGAAYRLKELGIDDFLVVEASSDVGGLAGSVTDKKGFVWDLGGHVHFSHYRYYDQALDRVMGPDAWFTLIRNSHIWMNDRFIPFPFQNNIHHLPLAERLRCLAGLIAVSGSQVETKHFGDWILKQYGRGIADLFLRPYNLKVWAHPLHMLDIGWMGERVAPIKLGPILLNQIFRKDNVSWGPNSTFRFPKHGGTGAIWKAMAAHVGQTPIQLNSPVVHIEGKKRIVHLAHGAFSYAHLISSIPLKTLGPMTDGLSPASIDASKRLRHSSTHIVGLGVRGRLPKFLAGKCWIYFPQPDVPFYRGTVLSNYSKYCVPDYPNHWSFMFEISESEFYRTGFDKPIERTAEAALRTGLIQNEADIVSTWHRRLEFGYPTPHVGRDEILNTVQPELEALRIYSRGRFGGWKYEASNQDHSFMQGVEAVNRLVEGTPEVTYPTPHVANLG